MIIAVPDPDSKEFPYGSNVTYIAKFFKKEEKSRSLTSTGSGFEKKLYGSKHWLLYVGVFQNKPVIQRKKNFFCSNPYCKISNVFKSNMLAYVKVPVAMGC